MECMDVNGNLDVAGRVWVDGCYDMVHFGHANSFRQARELGRHLTVGVHSDHEICQHKSAPPVFTQEERYYLVRSNKFVDEVVEDAPYVTTLQTLDKYGCDFCAHGNDITTTADGIDTYAEVKEKNRYKDVERTQGVSTTELINRLLKAGRVLFSDSEANKDCENEDGDGGGDRKRKSSPWSGSSGLILTTQKLKEFSSWPPPQPQDVIVYVAGTFDLLHAGHVRFLERARALGTYLVVGVYNDEDAAKISSCSAAFPLMSLNERCYNLLGCKYVSDIVMGAPLQISEELIDHLRIKVVARGEFGDPAVVHPANGENLYEVAENAGMLRIVDSGSKLVVEDIVRRVWKLRDVYDKRNKDKESKELGIISSQLRDEEIEQ